MTHGVRITQRFVDIANKASKILRQETRSKGLHCFDNANWHGLGTIVLHMTPPSRESWLKYKASYDKFFDALRNEGFLQSEPKEDTAWVAKRGHIFSVSVIIKGMEVY